MGKGKRNREKHLQNTLSGQAGKVKKANKNPVPSWLPSVIALVVVIAIMIPLVISAISGSGIVGRSRVLIESKTGKFDVNQQMATFIAWEYLYESGLQYYQYYQYGLVSDSSGIMNYFSSAEDYALTMAQSGVQGTLRDAIDDVAEMLKQYVAVCDLAYNEGYRLSEEDEADVDEVVTWLESMQKELGYNNFNSFLKVVICEGLKKKDIVNISEMVVLYNRYVSDKQLKLDSLITLDDILKHRDDNPADYYKADYLTYSTTNKEDSEKLSAATTELAFKTAVSEIFFKDNYKTTYNKYTTQVEATELYELIKNKSAEDLKNTLGEKNVEIKVYEDDDTANLEEGLVKYLFDSARKQYTSGTVTTDTGVYVVTPMTEITSTTEGDKTVKSIEAGVKFFAFVEGETHGEDTTFKTDLLKIFTENNTDVEDDKKTETDYALASEKAADLIAELTKTDADVAKILTDYGFTKDVLITKDTKTSETLPQAIIDKVNNTKNAVEAGKAYSVIDSKDDNKQYVLYINSVADLAKTVSYVALEDDLFSLILSDLQTALDKVFKAENTQAYKKDAADGTFEKWLCETTEGFTSARKDGETKVIETKKNEGKENEETTYAVYMALANEDNGSTVIYLDHSIVVKGGYLQFSDKAAAEAAMATLAGKTGNSLLTALGEIDSDKATGSVSTSNAYAKTTVESTNKDLAAWLFADGKTGNEMTVISTKDSSDKDVYFLAVYIERTEAWNRSARTSLLSQQVTDWMTELTASYTINVKKLNKIGAPSTTVAATTKAAAAA